MSCLKCHRPGAAAPGKVGDTGRLKARRPAVLPGGCFGHSSAAGFSGRHLWHLWHRPTHRQKGVAPMLLMQRQNTAIMPGVLRTCIWWPPQVAHAPACQKRRRCGHASVRKGGVDKKLHWTASARGKHKTVSSLAAYPVSCSGRGELPAGPYLVTRPAACMPCP